MRPEKKCPICRGRGYIRCDCWPGDCICGWDDEPCDNCEGTGWIYADEEEWELLPALTPHHRPVEQPPRPCDVNLPAPAAGGAAHPAERIRPEREKVRLAHLDHAPAGAADVGDMLSLGHEGTIGEHG